MYRKLILIALVITLCQGFGHNNKSLDKPIEGQHQQWFDYQVLDHFVPVPKTYWRQRFYVLPDYYDGSYGPMFLYICGESVCNGMPESRTFTKTLAEQHNGIVVTLEHRFYGASQPFGEDGESYATEKLKYLTHLQGLADLANFIGWIKEIGLYGINPDTPVITVGGSYPGAMSAWFRYKYESLTIGAYASSAVVNAINDFQQYDMQIGISTSVSGKYCPEDIRTLNDYIARQLNDPDTAKTLKQQFKATKLNDDEFLEMFADIFSGQVQYGKSSNLCKNILQNKTIEQQLTGLAALASDPDSYTVDYMKNTKYSLNSNSRQWTYQCCTAFGWWQTAYKKDPMRSTKVNIKYYDDKCKAIFGDEYLPNVPETNLLMGATTMSVTNIVFTNGGEDPWKWASILEDQPPMKAYVAECQDCGHCCDLSTPVESDPIELKYVREEVEKNVDKWIKEYRQKTYGDRYEEIDFKTKERVVDQEAIDAYKAQLGEDKLQKIIKVQ